MCLVHMYRPSCGHFAILEPVSQEDDAITLCEKAQRCKRPTVEIADLLSRCSQCHDEATQATAIPNMHRVDVTKFQHRRVKTLEPPKLQLDKLYAAGFERNITFNVLGASSRVWSKLRGEKPHSSRQRGRQSLEGFRYRRRTTFESPVLAGFYDLL